MLSLFRNLWRPVPSKWTKDGKLCYLQERTINRAAFNNLNVPNEVIEKALTTFCDSFDIPLEQMFQLRPSDEIQELYRRVRLSELQDDMEYERLSQAMDEQLGTDSPNTPADSIKTIGDLISYFHQHPPTHPRSRINDYRI